MAMMILIVGNEDWTDLQQAPVYAEYIMTWIQWGFLCSFPLLIPGGSSTERCSHRPLVHCMGWCCRLYIKHGSGKLGLQWTTPNPTAGETPKAPAIVDSSAAKSHLDIQRLMSWPAPIGKMSFFFVGGIRQSYLACSISFEYPKLT